MSDVACPGCEKQVQRQNQNTFRDAEERPWHLACARRWLALCFRTPLSTEEASVAVLYEGNQNVWRAPHSLHLCEIEFLENVRIRGIFVGATSVVCTSQQPLIYTRDLPDQRLVIDCDMPLGFDLTIDADTKNFKYRLLGQRRAENDRPRPAPYSVVSVAHLQHEEVIAPGDTATASFVMPGYFRGQRVVCDATYSWEITDVRLGVDAGRSVLNHDPVMIGQSVSVEMPAYETLYGERVTYHVKNTSSYYRPFDARVYGMLRWY